MSASEAYHYPPELLKLLTDVIPKLCKSKRDLLLFFRGAGVDTSVLGAHETALARNKEQFNKYHVTREILAAINAKGDSGLAPRRKVLQSVVEFENYSLCWENDRAAARGLVAEIRELVNVKDSFTRMKQEKDDAAKAHRDTKEASIRAARERAERFAAIKADLFGLFALSDAHARGKSLEGVLNRLFAVDGLLVKEAFTVKSEAGNVIEQIDGAIETDGFVYLVEMKWWDAPLGVGEVSPHLVRLFNRGGQARGLILSHSHFSAPAIEQCRDALGKGVVVVLATLEEIVQLLERQDDVQKWLRAKTHAAIADRRPHVKI